MSCTRTMDMALISTANLISNDQMVNIFNQCLDELNMTLKGRELIVNGKSLGVITINSRIILSFNSDTSTEVKEKYRELIRETFTRRVDVAHQNYLDSLESEKRNLEKQNIAEQALLSSINKIDKEIKQTKQAFERQHMDECEALKHELIDAAIEQGYEVQEEKTSQGLQLQFIRREY